METKVNIFFGTNIFCGVIDGDFDSASKIVRGLYESGPKWVDVTLVDGSILVIGPTISSGCIFEVVRSHDA